MVVMELVLQTKVLFVNCMFCCRQTMMEREELMENMYEKKIEILERNVLETQIYTRKKRKREKEEEEVCLFI